MGRDNRFYDRTEDVRCISTGGPTDAAWAIAIGLTVAVVILIIILILSHGLNPVATEDNDEQQTITEQEWSILVQDLDRWGGYVYIGDSSPCTIEVSYTVRLEDGCIHYFKDELISSGIWRSYESYVPIDQIGRIMINSHTIIQNS